MRDHGLDTYLSDINEVPLLTAQEEIELSKRVQRDDADAREHMIRANLRLVVSSLAVPHAVVVDDDLDRVHGDVSPPVRAVSYTHLTLPTIVGV